jgi:hypothetical protein
MPQLILLVRTIALAEAHSPPQLVIQTQRLASMLEVILALVEVHYLEQLAIPIRLMLPLALTLPIILALVEAHSREQLATLVQLTLRLITPHITIVLAEHFLEQTVLLGLTMLRLITPHITIVPLAILRVQLQPQPSLVPIPPL